MRMVSVDTVSQCAKFHSSLMVQVGEDTNCCMTLLQLSQSSHIHSKRLNQARPLMMCTITTVLCQQIYCSLDATKESDGMRLMRQYKCRNGKRDNCVTRNVTSQRQLKNESSEHEAKEREGKILYFLRVRINALKLSWCQEIIVIQVATMPGQF